VTGPWSDPVWPEEIEVQTDLAPSDWILPRLLPWGRNGTPVTSIVPSGYQAYVRVLHPAYAGLGVATWRNIAMQSRRTYHPMMQFHRINLLGDAKGRTPFDPPETGHLAPDLCHALYTALAAWSTTPDACWLGTWEGWGSLGFPRSMSFARFGSQQRRRDQEPSPLELQLTLIAERVRDAPRFHHPKRSYLLAKSPASAICQLARPPLHITPGLVWPDDTAWCAATEIDFDSTLVACSEECAEALVMDEGLEALRVPPDGRLDIGGDELNPPQVTQ
jgi:hypothetical protein